MAIVPWPRRFLSHIQASPHRTGEIKVLTEDIIPNLIETDGVHRHHVLPSMVSLYFYKEAIHKEPWYRTCTSLVAWLRPGPPLPSELLHVMSMLKSHQTANCLYIQVFQVLSPLPYFDPDDFPTRGNVNRTWFKYLVLWKLHEIETDSAYHMSNRILDDRWIML